MTLDKSNYGSKFGVYKSKVEVTGNKNIKIFFVHIFVKSRLI